MRQYIGSLEGKIIDLLRHENLKNTELQFKIFKELSQKDHVRINQTTKNLIKKGFVKKVGQRFHLIKEPKIIGILTGDKYKKISVPTMKQTKNWKKGHRIKLENLDIK